MGYDSRLIIVTAPHLGKDNKPTDTWKDTPFCLELASVDLCKVGPGPVGELFAASIRAEKVRIEFNGWRYSFYGADGNTQVSIDRYNDPVSPVDLDDLIAAIHSEIDGEEYPYRRHTMALGLLEAIAADKAQGRWPEGVVVLHYGH
jgi:hypothetical protein